MESEVKRKWRKSSITLVPIILLGLILFVSGAGKLPGQVEFMDVLLGSFWGPTMAFLISELLPWAELVLGVALLLWVYPRIVAILSLPLILGFIASNGAALGAGMEEFPECGYCFGVLEKIFGAVSPVQAMGIDIALLVFAIIIIVCHPGGFVSFRPWFLKFFKRGH